MRQKHTARTAQGLFLLLASTAALLPLVTPTNYDSDNSETCPSVYVSVFVQVVEYMCVLSMRVRHKESRHIPMVRM